MPFRRVAIALVTVVASVLAAFATRSSRAGAQNPAWPNRTAARAELSSPANWPDDPGYGYDIGGAGGTRWTNATGGQWNVWSWIPPEALAREELRDAERDLGAGSWTDMAWQITIGEPSIVIAVLDSGIKWDESDLENKYFIHRAELERPSLGALCLPRAPAGHMGDPVDIDGDGALTMHDWIAGRTPAEADAIRAELDGMGNTNGHADPGDLIVICSDGIDDDANGYVDDISGWDFMMDDNDPYDDTRYGHGSGEARDSMAEANNGIGEAGLCPRCRALMVRVGDSFVADVQDYAQGVVFAVDSGASVIQEALGTVNTTTFARRAMDYAYSRGVLIVASAADENSRHHNLPGTNNHTLYVHAIQYAGTNPQSARSYLAFNNCTNYGGQLVLSAPGTACSSEATGVTSGMAGLVYSAAIAPDRPGGALAPPLSAEEARQALLMNADDIDIPESQPSSPDYEPLWYPSRSGWDQRFGYGRVNAYRAVSAVRDGRIPPEVDVTYPDWFRVIDPAGTPSVVVRGKIAARRAPSFDWAIEWARGIEPEDGDWRTIASGAGATTPIEGDLATWDVSAIEIDNEGEVENRYTVTIRIRVTAKYGGAIGDVRGEQRRVFAIRHEPTLLPGFPIALGVSRASDAYRAASGEGSPKMANIDGDAALEILYADADGLLHAINGDGSAVPGYPVRVGPLRGLDPAAADSYLGSPAYASGGVPTDDISSSILSSLAVGDLDADGALEIVVATLDGDVYAYEAASATLRTGWPVGLPPVLSGDTLRMRAAGTTPTTSPKRVIDRGVFAAPSLVDLDGDGKLEVVVAAFDGYLHVFREDGTVQPGFPVLVHHAGLWPTPEEAEYGRIMTAPAIGDVNGDGIPDIAVGSNETGFEENTGAVHLVHGDGNLHAGGAEHPSWPIRIESLDLLPLVGEGIVSPLAMADVTGDRTPEIAVAGTGANMFILTGVQPARAPGTDLVPLVAIDGNSRGALTDVLQRSDRPVLNVFAAGAFGDLDADGTPEFITGGAGLQLALNLAGGYANVRFTHQVGAWNTADGKMIAGFPRAIEDYMFFVNPTVADVSGDAYPEVIVGSGGYYLHAWDACGREPEGWPKFVGGWMTSSAAVGDVDGDGALEVAISTRSGYLWVFHTDGRSDGAIGWSEYRHDNRNTGNYEMPLSNGGVPVKAGEPIVCPLPPAPDGGVAPLGGAPGGGGCDCRVAPDRGRVGRAISMLAWVAVMFALGVRRRRRALRTGSDPDQPARQCGRGTSSSSGAVSARAVALRLAHACASRITLCYRGELYVRGRRFDVRPERCRDNASKRRTSAPAARAKRTLARAAPVCARSGGATLPADGRAPELARARSSTAPWVERTRDARPR